MILSSTLSSDVFQSDLINTIYSKHPRFEEQHWNFAFMLYLVTGGQTEQESEGEGEQDCKRGV